MEQLEVRSVVSDEYPAELAGMGKVKVIVRVFEPLVPNGGHLMAETLQAVLGRDCDILVEVESGHQALEGGLRETNIDEVSVTFVVA